MSKDLINIDAISNKDWENFTREVITFYGSKYQYYIHTSNDPITIGGGPYGEQTIYPIAIGLSDEEFLIESIERLDNLIDLDFERDWNAHLTASRFFLDSTIEINGNPLGIAVANIKEGKLWYEIILNGGDLVDDYYRRYVFLHEYGHTLGLEHPFDDQDGDSAGGTDPWTSKIYPEDTVMAYREPQSGEWPQWFSDSDIRALVKMWGLEDDVRS